MTRFTDRRTNIAVADLGEFRGPGSIGSVSHGLVVRKNGAPVSRPVQIIPMKRPNMVIAETTSDANGNWSISNLSLTFKYFVLVKPDDDQANPAMVQWVTPV